MNRRDLSIFLLFTLLPAASAAGDELLAHGTAEMYWVARVVEPGATPAETDARTIIRARTVGGEGRWGTVAQPRSRIVSLANRGTELAALSDASDWMLLWPNGSASGAQPDDGGKLVALASGADSVWAIASGGREASTTASATRSAGDDRPHSSLAIYRLERGRWSRKAWLPPAITPSDAPKLAATALPSGPIVSVVRTGGLIETVRLNERDWESLPSLEAGSVQRIKLMTDGQRAILWAAGDGGAGTIYQLTREWSKPMELRMPDPPRPGEARTIALAGNNLRLLVQRDRKILEQSFSLDGTALTSAPVALPAAPAMPDSTPNRILTLVAAAMLMLVVLGSLRRGGGAAPASVATDAGITPAPLLPRLVAGIIDAMPLIIPSWFIFKDVDPSTEEMLSASTSWSVYAALGAYLAYNWLFEALFGRGVGKMLFGLRVVMLDGSPPPQRAIFARNVLRLVDVTMAAVPLILVLLSPLHQRAGDIAAKTVVIRSGAQSQDSADQPGE